MPVADVKLSDLLEKGGAYAGLAAFFGLAVLVILYFAQARELKRLREWAGRAPERAQELEARVLASADVARRAAPRPPGAPATAAGTAATTPAATAAAPATAAAAAAAAPAEGKEDEAKPGDVAATNGDAPAAATAEPTPEGDEEPAATAGADAEKAPDGEQEDKPADQPPAETEKTPGGETDVEAPAKDQEGAGTPAPAVAAATAAASARGATPPASAPASAPAPPPRPPRPLPQRAAPPNVAGRRPAPAAAPLRSGTSASRRPPARRPGPGTPSGDDGHGRRTAVRVGGGLLAAVVAVVAAVALLGGGDDKAPKTASATATPTADGTASATPTPAAGTERGDVTVAVLNGTTISGLASTLADRIAAAGFKRGETANYVDQARADTLVLFGDASGARRAAFEVAKVIDAGSPPQVQPADESAKRLAPSAQVVVVVGADQSP